MVGEPTDEEEEAGARTRSGFGSGESVTKITADYFPEKEDYFPKTRFGSHDAWRAATVMNIGSLFPSAERHQEIYDAWMHYFMRSKVSEDGAGRAEFRDMIMAMHGQNPEGSQSAGLEQVVMQGLGADEED